jgi:hypothetical protein
VDKDTLKNILLKEFELNFKIDELLLDLGG